MNNIMQQIGRYEIVKVLGHGAMGMVYAAIDPLIGRKVAIKTIRLDTLEDDQARADLTRRLFREAQSAGILSHPGIITVYDVGEHGTIAFIVMEFVAGKTLEEVLASGVPQHSEVLFSILRQAANALDYAHTKGIVHRDIKPANIMICDDGTSKIADFGVAKISASTSLTQTGFVLGTPSYMSPEQAQGREIDGRSDEFSMAVVAFRMITGKLPFEGPTLTALLAKILWEEPQYETSGLDDSIKPVFEKALAKNPQLRFPLCADFVHELESGYAPHKAGLQSRVTASAKLHPEDRQPLPQDAETVVAGALTATEPTRLEPVRITEEYNSKPGSAIPTAGPVESPRVTIPETEKNSLNPVPAIPPKQEMRAESAETSFAPMPSKAPPEQKKKHLLIVLAASLSLLLLVAALFFAVRPGQAPNAPAVELPSAASLPPSPNAPAEPPQAPISVKKSEPPVIVERPRPRAKAAVSATPLPGLKETTPPAEVAPPATKEVAAPPKIHDMPIQGILTWSGKLEKNSILVIGANSASIGKIAGNPLPGKPVLLELEPKEIAIRQAPNKENGWQQIMLYSGKVKYSSITIRWKTIEN